MLTAPTQSYLLRLWREHGGAGTRITVIEVGSPDERHHFGTMPEFLAWLDEQSAGLGAPSTAPTGHNTRVVQ